ncbi:MAG TPA: carbohydrate porin [Phycisphaerae bacterium]|nr:carbohydrate porin [Phycisphaerae bacterium]HOJ72364.1 carbohydrate porin [Phycisphaerae bacterium]HOM49974.1 carbohydrate porin [Phycisphaerae bacterium]HON66219.1 carbohydrate porin [Phycisphaerae bacterium]HOQ84601.1 carbohydrate porin [Phycisphaerae bacterium]
MILRPVFAILAVALGTCAAADSPSNGEDASAPPQITEAKGAVEPGEATSPQTQPAEDDSIGGEGAMDHLIRMLRLPHPRSDIWPGFEAYGITLNLSMTSIYQQNAHGGVNTHNAHRVTGSVDTELTFDFEKMGLWKGGQLYTFVESGWQDAIDEDVGDLFGVNGDALGDRAIRVRELWYQQMLFDDRLRFKVGKMDLAVDIDTNAYANWEVTQFLNSALINTGNMPLPDFGLGAVLSVIPTDWLYVTFAAADAQADGNETGFRTTFHGADYFFGAMELGLTPVWEVGGARLPGAYRFILWYDPQSKEVFFDDRDGRRRRVPHKRDDTGFVFNMDQLVYKENPGTEDTQGLGVFARYGYAPEDANLIEHFWSLGAQYQGLLPGRDNDVLAFGFAQGILSDRFRAVEKQGGRESVYEIYYNAAVLPWLNITPDFQYIMDTGGDRSGRDAFVVGVRVVVAF